MAKTVIITDGVGTDQLINDTYTVSSEVNGYDNTSINPASIVITEGVDTYSFTIGANGTLTLHVSEDGTAGGTPIVGATFIRTDAEGNEYGSQITTDAQGNAIFENVPYAQTDAPVIYFKQLASDGNHEFSTEIQNTTMTSDTATLEITNAPGATRTIELTDANYENLPLSGNLTLTN